MMDVAMLGWKVPADGGYEVANTPIGCGVEILILSSKS